MRIREAIVENLDRRGGAGRLQFQRHEADPTIEGRTLQAVADERGMKPADLAMALLRAGGAGVVSFNMHDADVATFMQQIWTMTYRMEISPEWVRASRTPAGTAPSRGRFASTCSMTPQSA
jgi:hypothetical protein